MKPAKVKVKRAKQKPFSLLVKKLNQRINRTITSVSIRVISVISGRVLAWIKTETQIVEPDRIELDSATT